MPILYAMILCIGPNNYGAQCISRDFGTLDTCKAFVASAEAAAENTKGFAYAKGICVPIQGAR